MVALLHREGLTTTPAAPCRSSMQSSDDRARCRRCRETDDPFDLRRPSCSACLDARLSCSLQYAKSNVMMDSARGPPASLEAAFEQSASSSGSGSTSTPPSVAHRDAIQAAEPKPATAVLEPGMQTSSSTSPASRHFPEDNPLPMIDGTSPTRDGPPSPVSGTSRVSKKRKRNCLSCLRCHRLKVKCDKKLPCARCVSSSHSRECYYAYNKGRNEGRFACPEAPLPSLNKEEKRAKWAPWRVLHKTKGPSHWRRVMAVLAETGSKLTTPNSELALAIERIGSNACLVNFYLPGNFPFGTPASIPYHSRDAVTKLLASERHRSDEYIKRYFDLFDTVNPVVDLPTLQQEMVQYWKDPGSVSLCWLSQFLMILGLGCYTTDKEPPAGAELMMAAEACLMQTPYMSRPTFMAVRALTLMCVAKMVCNATCWAAESTWALLGLLVRVALVFGLPQDFDEDEKEAHDQVDVRIRRRLWLTIVYLDVKVSSSTGMPPLTKPADLGNFHAAPDADDASPLHVVLGESLPTTLEILAKTNAQVEITYDEVLHYNEELRKLMDRAQQKCTAELHRMTLDIFFRRCLMILHQPFALHGDAAALFPASYWSSLECAAAMLYYTRETWLVGPSASRLDLVGRCFTFDFLSSALTVSVLLLRDDPTPMQPAAAFGQHALPRQVIVNGMKHSLSQIGPVIYASACTKMAHSILAAVIHMLPDPSPT